MSEAENEQEEFEKFLFSPARKDTKAFYLRWCAEKIGNFTLYNVKDFICQSFHHLYTTDLNAFYKAFEYSSINAKLYLAAYLVNRNPDYHDELKKWVEDVLQNSFNLLFTNLKSEDVIEMVKKYLNGETPEVTNLATEFTEKIDITSLQVFYLHVIIENSIIMYEHSVISRRFIKLMLLMIYDKIFPVLDFTFKSGMGHDGEKQIMPDIADIVNDLNIPKRLYIAWLAGEAVYENDYYAILKKEVKENIYEARKAMEVADKGSFVVKEGVEYLMRILLEIESDDERITSAENSYINLFKDYFININIPESTYNNYLAFLRGEKEFEEIKESVKKNIRQKAIIDYEKSFVEGAYMIKNFSTIVSRSLCFLVYGKKYSLARQIAGFGYMDIEDRHFNRFIEILKSAGIKRDGILIFAVDYACGLYREHAQVFEKPAIDFIHDIIRNSPDEILSNMVDYSDWGRAYVLEYLYLEHQEKYIPFIEQYLEDSSQDVRETVARIFEIYHNPNITNIFSALLRCYHKSKGEGDNFDTLYDFEPHEVDEIDNKEDKNVIENFKKNGRNNMEYKIMLIAPDYDKNEAEFNEVPEVILNLNFDFDSGIPFNRSKIDLEVNKKSISGKKLVDFMEIIGIGAPVINNRVKYILEALNTDGIEYIPISMPGNITYWIINILHMPPCIDQDKSDLEYFKHSKTIFSIDSLVINQDSLDKLPENAHIIRMQDYPSIIMISSLLSDIFDKNKITGIEIEEPEDFIL